MLQEVPDGLSDKFALDSSRIAIWNAFVSRNKLDVGSLKETVQFLREHFIFAFMHLKN